MKGYIFYLLFLYGLCDNIHLLCGDEEDKYTDKFINAKIKLGLYKSSNRICIKGDIIVSESLEHKITMGKGRLMIDKRFITIPENVECIGFDRDGYLAGYNTKDKIVTKNIIQYTLPDITNIGLFINDIGDVYILDASGVKRKVYSHNIEKNQLSFEDDSIYFEDSLYSENRIYRLTIENKLVLYKNGEVITMTNPLTNTIESIRNMYMIKLTKDGILQIIDDIGKIHWTSSNDPLRNVNNKAIISDDGILQIYHRSKIVWSMALDDHINFETDCSKSDYITNVESASYLPHNELITLKNRKICIWKENSIFDIWSTNLIKFTSTRIYSYKDVMNNLGYDITVKNKHITIGNAWNGSSKLYYIYKINPYEVREILSNKVIWEDKIIPERLPGQICNCTNARYYSGLMQHYDGVICKDKNLIRIMGTIYKLPKNTNIIDLQKIDVTNRKSSIKVLSNAKTIYDLSPIQLRNWDRFFELVDRIDGFLDTKIIIQKCNVGKSIFVVLPVENGFAVINPRGNKIICFLDE